MPETSDSLVWGLRGEGHRRRLRERGNGRPIAVERADVVVALADRDANGAAAAGQELVDQRPALLFAALYPHDHPAFHSNNWATLNVTLDAMVRYGWAPSVRLFETAACGACIVRDVWPGLDKLLEPDREILLARDRSDVLRHLRELTPERRATIGGAARRRILDSHTYDRRAEQLEAAYDRVMSGDTLAEAAR